MRKAFYTTIVGLLCLLSSCYTFKAGKYRSSFGALLEIKNDSTYDYFFREGWHQYQSTGKWYEVKGSLILNSFYSTTKIPILVNEKEEPLSDKKKFSVIGIEKLDTSFLHELTYEISINGTKKLSSKESTLYVPKGTSVNTIQIVIRRKFEGVPYLLNDSLSSILYNVVNQQINEFNITIPNIRDDFYKEYWSNREFIIKKRKIIDRGVNKSFYLQ